MRGKKLLPMRKPVNLPSEGRIFGGESIYSLYLKFLLPKVFRDDRFVEVEKLSIWFLTTNKWSSVVFST